MGLCACLLPIIGCLEISFPSSFIVLCFIDARSSSLVSSFNPLKIQAPIKQRAIMDEGKLSNRGPDMAEVRKGKVISFAPSTSSTIRGTRYCSTPWEQTTGSPPSTSQVSLMQVGCMQTAHFHAMHSIARMRPSMKSDRFCGHGWISSRPGSGPDSGLHSDIGPGQLVAQALHALQLSGPFSHMAAQASITSATAIYCSVAV